MFMFLMFVLLYLYIYVYVFCGICMVYDIEEFFLKMLKKGLDVG